VGCYWQASSSTCSGSITPCTAFSDQTTCRSQSGCVWQ
jgi:hypothetical protein